MLDGGFYKANEYFALDSLWDNGQILGTKVLNEVAFGLENLGLSREEIFQRVDEALAHLKIQHLRGRDTFLLSGGEKQKVALAGLLVMQPSILLLDEPLASLDPASAHEALAVFRSLADEATDCPLAVIHNGCVINDPHHPYRGCYAGDEDTGRKPAYHN
ncbi:MAG: ATP-binding cassette domain-containing protein, partial [Chloroflexi bacterium]|nr:ATP-binding cassette domain-containing protein [Chloroflexota bacterium]